MGYIEDTRHWIAEHKLRTVVGLWAGGLATSMAYQWTRPIPTQLKIIHSRVYAQALTLGALGAAAVVDLYEHQARTKANPHVDDLTPIERDQLERAKKTGHMHHAP
jgi:hypothetical protein